MLSMRRVGATRLEMTRRANKSCEGAGLIFGDNMII